MMFHQYPVWYKFTIIADHKPLLATLGPKEGIPIGCSQTSTLE